MKTDDRVRVNCPASCLNAHTGTVLEVRQVCEHLSWVDVELDDHRVVTFLPAELVAA